VGPNVARQIRDQERPASRGAGVHRQPGLRLGLRAIINAADQIRPAKRTSSSAGGTESMSNTPYLLTRARFGSEWARRIVDGMYRDGFHVPARRRDDGLDRGRRWPEQYGISREEQDRFAVESQAKAARA